MVSTSCQRCILCNANYIDPGSRWLPSDPAFRIRPSGMTPPTLRLEPILTCQVNYLIADGKSHWLEGVLLMMMYLIISVAAW